MLLRGMGVLKFLANSIIYPNFFPDDAAGEDRLGFRKVSKFQILVIIVIILHFQLHIHLILQTPHPELL